MPQAGFGSRGRLRRRARFLRKARELGYRDLGGLVFSLHRFGQRNDSLVLAKLSTLGRIDAELRVIEDNLSERQPLTVLREAGITACPRCAAIHSSEDRFCPNCGLAMSRHRDLPIAGAPPAGSPQAPASAPQPTPPAATAPAPAPGAPAALSGSPSGTSPAPVFPATAQHPAAPLSPANPAAAAGPASPSTPAQPAPTPATQAFDAVPSSSGGSNAERAPVPPVSSQDQLPALSDDDQPTEIIRPPTGS